MSASVRGIKIDDRDGIMDTTKRTYVTTYLVTTTDKNDGPEIVRQAAGLPGIGDIYTAGNDTNQNAVVTEIDIRARPSPTEWEVDVLATTDLEEDPDTLFQEGSPLLNPAKITYTTINRSVPAEGFYTDSAAFPQSPDAEDYQERLVASNGEPPLDPIEVDVDESVCKIEKNYSLGQFQSLNIQRLNNTVNSTIFAGQAPRTLKLRTKAKTKWHKTIGTYWVVCFIFRFKYDTWDFQIPNVGTYFWNGGLPASDHWADANDSSRKVKTAAGRPLVVDLSATGDISTSPGTTTYTRRRYYREIDFNTLGLP